MLKCQEIKHYLSVRESELLDVNDYDATKNGLIQITRQEFETMAVDLLTRINKVIDSALNFHSFFKINRVLQVGGGCRMPMIKNLLEARFADAELCCEEHPDEVVAIGAAYYAYHLFSAI